MKLSKHFTLEQMTVTGTGLKNVPNASQIERLKVLAEKILDPLQDYYAAKGLSVKINSAFRSPAVNKAVRGAATSQHMTGEAADIEVPGLSNWHLAHWINDNPDKYLFDQLILEFHDKTKPDSGWVHVSYRPQGRKQVLTVNRAVGTKKGLVA